MATLISWSFSHLENGLVRLASDAGHILDMHPIALVQMTAHELLSLLERRAAEAATPAPVTPEPTESAPVSGEEPVEQPVEQSDAGSAE